MFMFYMCYKIHVCLPVMSACVMLSSAAKIYTCLASCVFLAEYESSWFFITLRLLFLFCLIRPEIAW